MGFFSLVVICIDLLAWPIVAFGYPLCASVHAIETDSASETRNLISYWIFLSLIYLVEQAFAPVLQWLKVWNYIKLVIVFWLAIPRFERAYQAYNRLVRPYISMDVRSLTIWFKSWKELLVKRENFLVLAGKYIEENGPEALEKLIAKELKSKSSLEVEEKTENQQVDSVFSIAERRETESTVEAGKEFSASKKVQREWTCAICQVTMESERVLNDHLGGKKHRAKCEALNKKNQEKPQIASPVLLKKPEHSNEGSDKNAPTHAWKQKNTINEYDSEKEWNEELVKNVLHDEMDKTICEEKKINPQITYPATCRLCNVRCNSESDMDAHSNGRKHKANVQILLLPKLIHRPKSSSGVSV